MKNCFAHERALVEEGAQVGLNTRIWAFAHILGAQGSGADCRIAVLQKYNWSSEEETLLSLYEKLRK